MKSNTSLERNLQLAVVVYIKESGKNSFIASNICEELVKNDNAEKKLLPSGNYAIFPLVCMFLEELVAKEKLQFIKKINGIDRLYRVVDSYLLTNQYS